MRSFWLTGWLLAALLACSAADPRIAIAEAPAAPTRPPGDRPANPLDKLLRTNLEEDEIRAAVALAGSARAQKIDELSAGWSRRRQLLQQAAAAHDQVQAAVEKGNALAQAEAEIQYEQLKEELLSSNLSSRRLRRVASGPREMLQSYLADLRGQCPDFAQRVQAIDGVLSVDSAVLQSGRPARRGILEFHVLATGQDLETPEAQAMLERLKPGGKGVDPQPGDTLKWFLVDRPEDIQGTPTAAYDGDVWVLGWTTPDRQMVHDPARPAWQLESASPSMTEMGIRAIGFRLDAAGAEQFAELTSNNLKRAMAVMLDDEVISVATIQSVISREGIISRESGYSDAEWHYLISTLNAGASIPPSHDAPATAAPPVGSLYWALEHWPVVLIVAVNVVVGVAVAVIWLARSRTTRGAVNHEDPVLGRKTP